MNSIRKEFFKIIGDKNNLCAFVSDENGKFTKLDKIEPIPYSSDCFLVSVGKRQRIVNCNNSQQNVFPYDLVKPFSNVEEKRFSEVLNYHTELQGYWFKKFDGTYIGLAIYLSSIPHYVYEIMLYDKTYKPIKEIIPILAVKMSGNFYIDFWKLIYTDNSHDILITDLGGSCILDGKKFM